MVRRFDCLKLLASWMDEDMLSVTSLSGNAREWPAVCMRGHHFHHLNMGMCLSFALGLSLAFPKRKVIALESDGSLLLDMSSLVTLADINPPNFVAIVFDNGEYGKNGPTATSRSADIEQMARGAGIKAARTIREVEEFADVVKDALMTVGLRLFVVKVKPGREPRDRPLGALGDYHRPHGRAMKENFLEKLRTHPDYQSKEGVTTGKPV